MTDIVITQAVETHVWHDRFDLTCCKACGIVRRADRQNKPCRGVVKVALRATAIRALEHTVQDGRGT